MKPRAFTLIELLVVVAIIALLVAIMIPTMKSAKEQARRAVCATNLHSMIKTINMYAHNYQNSLWPAVHKASPYPELGHQWYGPIKMLLDDFSGKDYRIFDCPNIAPLFSMEMEYYESASHRTYLEYAWGEQCGFVMMGYYILGKAADQNYIEDVWPNGAVIPSRITDPPDTPIIVDVGSGMPDSVQGWSQAGHLEGGGGHHFVLEWYRTGYAFDLSGDYRLAGSNQGHLGGHVQWVDFEDMEWTSGYGTGGWWRPKR